MFRPTTSYSVPLRRMSNWPLSIIFWVFVLFPLCMSSTSVVPPASYTIWIGTRYELTAFTSKWSFPASFLLIFTLPSTKKYILSKYSPSKVLYSDGVTALFSSSIPVLANTVPGSNELLIGYSPSGIPIWVSNVFEKKYNTIMSLSTSDSASKMMRPLVLV